MNRRISIFLAVVLVSLALSTGCGGGSGTTQQPFTGFYVSTTYGPVGAQLPNGDVYFEGTSAQQLIQCSPSTDSNCILDTGIVETNAQGAYTVTTDDLPDYWGFTTYVNANCPRNITYAAEEVYSAETVVLNCDSASILFTATPGSYVYGYGQNTQPPTSIVLSATTAVFPASPLPTVSSYDESGDLETSIEASSVSSDQTTLTFTPNSTVLAAGNHILVVAAADGDLVGAAPFTVFHVLPPSNPCTDSITASGSLTLDAAQPLIRPVC
ncbi:MAG: hypothetical protein ACLQG3_12400 [Terracidiphilus sp.]